MTIEEDVLKLVSNHSTLKNKKAHLPNSLTRTIGKVSSSLRKHTRPNVLHSAAKCIQKRHRGSKVRQNNSIPKTEQMKLYNELLKMYLYYYETYGRTLGRSSYRISRVQNSHNIVQKYYGHLEYNNYITKYNNAVSQFPNWLVNA